MYYDIHTHSLEKYPNTISIVNLSPDNYKALHTSVELFSIGLHPWHIHADRLEEDILFIKETISHPHAKMIGECGLDKVCETPFDLQEKAFIAQINISEQIGKSLIIHCVKAFDEVIALKKKMNPQQDWIIHGFRGKPEQALQLAKFGFFFSLGTKFNINSIQTIPLHQLFFETDDENTDIRLVYQSAARILSITEDTLIQKINCNVKSRLFDT